MRLFGLIGKPLTHSFSKTFFTQKFSDENLPDCRYENFELPDVTAVNNLLQQQLDLQGLNVTIPYKESILPFLHHKNDVVEKIRACNCIHIKNGRLHGYNTDVIGFEKTLRPHLQSHHTKALVLGTGGAAKAVYYVLENLGITYLSLSRTKKPKSSLYTELTEELLQEHAVIINTTPLGMHPSVDEYPPLTYQWITEKHLLFDLIYNPAKTVFLQKGEERGAAIVNGHSMLVIQAEESWKIWNRD